MKLREPVQRYEVGKHGSEYIDYSGPAMICPECQGTNVCEIEISDNETNRNGDYIGEGTLAEIQFAKCHNIQVKYLEGGEQCLTGSKEH